MSDVRISESALLSSVKFRGLLVVWTLGIWGSRMRNIQADTELVGSERDIAFAVAVTFLASAALTAVALLRHASWYLTPLLVLVVVGIVRWTIRGPAILLSDEWEIAFKVVHTVLWLVTVALSVLAWREHRRASSS